MQIYVSTFVGFFVSVALFWLTYRQTAGARKERVKSANTDLEKILLRRIVLESYQPTLRDLSFIINGKARDFRVKSRDLLSESQLLETLVTRISESDFIDASRRQEILDRLSPILISAEDAPIDESRLTELPSKKQKRIRLLVTLSAGIFASILGTFTALITLPKKELALDIKDSSFIPVMIAFIASMAAIILMIIINRLRESQEEDSETNSLQLEIDFEQTIQRFVRKHARNIIYVHPKVNFDFIALFGDRKILIEVKTWARPVPSSVIFPIVSRLNQAIKDENASEAIVVTRADMKAPSELLKDTQVHIMSLREFRNYIVHKFTK